MMWDKVVPAWLDLLEADAVLAAALGLDADGGIPIYPAQAARPVRVPSVEWFGPVVDIEGETFNPITVQVDYWARGVAKAAAIERRIREITHRDTARVVGGYRMWTQYEDSRSHDYPADPGVIHRSLDFMFTPLRDKYVA